MEKNKPKPKVKPKPKEVKPKVKPKPKEVKVKSKKSRERQKTYIGVTILKDPDTTTIDQYYDRKVNGIIDKIKKQNEMFDEKIRFGWNNNS